MKSLINRTKHSMNVHPMYRDNLPRRTFGPVIFNKNLSQDRLIAELHGKLGIKKKEPKNKMVDDWLTEGLVITSKPAKKREEGGHVVEKIILTPEPPSSKGSTPSPHPLSPSPLLQQQQDQNLVTLSPPLPDPSLTPHSEPSLSPFPVPPSPLPVPSLPLLPVPTPPSLPVPTPPPLPVPIPLLMPSLPYLPVPSPPPLPEPSLSVTVSFPPPLPVPPQPPLPVPSLPPPPRPVLSPPSFSVPSLPPSPFPQPSSLTTSSPLSSICPGSQSGPECHISFDKSEKSPALPKQPHAPMIQLEHTLLPDHYPPLPRVQTTTVQAEPLPSLSTSPRVMVSIACQTNGKISDEDSLLVQSQAWTILSLIFIILKTIYLQNNLEVSSLLCVFWN
ncbi:uncharacterized protein [Narcine bancroftii]|uniref:uncharacterized protein n=1 Tax=Narcine bancroftii TaxID=1343680 RepID=UPI003831FB3F